jgi:hypothetical protein
MREPAPKPVSPFVTQVAAAAPTPPAAAPQPFVTQVAAVMPAAPPALPIAPLTQTALPPAAPIATPPAPPAEFRLLVGETRSRSEAFALAIRLTSQRGARLGLRKPQIAAGTMADVVVYRVRLGPFADASQAMALCSSLRASGYPCITE